MHLFFEMRFLLVLDKYKALQNSVVNNVFSCVSIAVLWYINLLTLGMFIYSDIDQL